MNVWGLRNAGLQVIRVQKASILHLELLRYFSCDTTPNKAESTGFLSILEKAGKSCVWGRSRTRVVIKQGAACIYHVGLRSGVNLDSLL